ncbi:hypothetical protein CTA2_8619 [Colletotrichum tanaceti]|uniref:Uncharacterized protein n=1 Tax=Colletotrichum tanaceti TaxID=1306861 RepID=A0A4U6X8E3_9PEZI|nr:hypothetical protein CTA2_8619 [Colletotrichum tanaceti]TKW51800.1 hypothetical protein CTA1_1848 [Colletotrichum tanaceti]
MTANEESWDLDTDETRSVDSEELYETRPNRWRGQKSTWQTYTQEERLLYRSMEQLRNRDLSVHLYNAFALKHRPVRPSATAEPADAEDVEKLLQEVVDSGEWRPPDLWTAWPMNHRNVPGDDFLKETHDEDDVFTFRSKKELLPSAALQEELTATILRQAKERFRRRQQKYHDRHAARTRDESAYETTEASSAAAYSAISSDDNDDDVPSNEENAEEKKHDERARNTERPKRSKTYEAVVSANDDLSANLLRPSVRHILSTLDSTLTALHNSRVAGLSYMTDSSASATDGEASEASDAASVSSAVSRASSTTRRKRKGAPRSKAPRTPEPERRTTERRGRPRKAQLPLPGETEKEMKIRIAREQKKRIPFSSDEEDNADQVEEDGKRKKNGDEDAAETSSETLRSPRKKQDLPPEARLEIRTKTREAILGGWGLRDWSDVIGAASLAGFKPEVVARAAQRCADLFGEGMEMNTLLEGPASKGSKPQRTRYLPGDHHHRRSFSSVSGSDSEVERPTIRRRVRSRQGSLARDSMPPSDSDVTGTARGRGSRAPSRARSTSRSSSVGLFCSVAGCPRSAEGFARRANLSRHMVRVHPGQAVEAGDVESEDEMDGAVHVDGFLKPIRARKGWRAEDSGTRKRKRHYRGRRVEESGASEGSGVGEESVWDST